MENPYIYCITNLITGEMYIGQHNGLQLNYMGSGKELKKSYEYWTIDVFNKTILEYTSKDLLDERERFWISYYNTFNGSGYNLTPGGEKSDPDIFCRLPKEKTVIQYDKKGNFIKKWDSMVTAYQSLQLTNYDGISATCRGIQKTSGGYIWTYEPYGSIPQKLTVNLTHKNKNKNKPTHRCIAVKDLDSGIIYRSISEASVKLGFSEEYVRKIVHKNFDINNVKTKRKLIKWQK